MDYVKCDVPACGECVPEDCTFSDWSNWAQGPGCSGVCTSERTVAKQNNGCGVPCTGEMKKTKSCPASNCSTVSGTDCVFDDWTEWDLKPCDGSRMDTSQKYRTRSFTKATDAGKPCTGPTKDTAPCATAEQPQDCVWSDWSDYTACSVSCGPGRMTRVRRVFKEARLGGQTCAGPAIEVARCGTINLVSLLTKAVSPGDTKLPVVSVKGFVLKGELKIEAGGSSQEGRTIKNISGLELELASPLSSAHPVNATVLMEKVPQPTSSTRRLQAEPASIMEVEPRRRQAGNDVATASRPRKRPLVSTTSHTVDAADVRRLADCNVNDCVLTDWSAWMGCTRNSPTQKTRTRQVGQAATNGGKSCVGALKEVTSCPTSSIPALQCNLTDWSDWTACDKTCNGGQQFRHRVLKNPSGEAVFVPGSMREVQACNNGVNCIVPSDNDCKLLAWSSWGACSSACGLGLHHRTRDVQAAVANGTGCGVDYPAPLEQIGNCTGTSCDKIDCLWADWEDWSGCSLTCGGGTKRRHRRIKLSPENKGAACPAHVKSEVIGCNTTACPSPCIDAVFGLWSHWTKCSVTCGQGYKSRTRHVEREPNECGREVSGLLQEYDDCSGTIQEHCVPPVDCELGMWDDWSACSATCWGIRERNRVVTKFPQGAGLGCGQEGMRQVEGCNPVPGQTEDPMCSTLNPAKDCILSQWGDWSECSNPCDKGQKHRVRHILQTPMHNGTECPMNLSVTTGCNGWSQEKCGDKKNPCIDCVMADWGPWSACTKTGDQKRRTRGIKTQRNQCGEPCADTTTKEIAKCSSVEHQGLYCKWGSWREWSDCPSGCGTTTQTRDRSLEISSTMPTLSGELLFEIAQGNAHRSMVCAGTQKDVRACPTPTACSNGTTAVNCAFSAWSNWTNASATGLCSASRHIGVVNNAAGQPCSGYLVKTKKCEVRTKQTLDCTLSSWGMWSHCSNPVGQRERFRRVRQFPQEGGVACPDVDLKQTAPCARTGHPPQNCQMSDWTKWGECSRTCDAGWHIRTRRIVVPALHGGHPCNSTMEELQACNTQKCSSSSDVDCQLGDWESWSGCQAHGQKYRNRYITTEAKEGGAACSSPTRETGSCKMETIDCKLSDWAAWMPCSMTCRGGTKARHRQVDRWPVNGGQPCPPNLTLINLTSCNDDTPCSDSTDCKMSDWTEWSNATCSTTCGPGQITRTRFIKHNRTGPSGQGCNSELTQQAGCPNNPACPKVDCKWSAWTLWTQCTKTCGGGRQHRNRQIDNEPENGGANCSASLKEEMKNCSTNVCPAPACVNGKWADWQAWEPCSKTCRGGMTWRSRAMNVTANSCGMPPDGLSQQVASCLSNVSCVPNTDCEMSDWSDWSTCSTSCDGQRTSTRTVLSPGSGDGTFCTGALKKVAPCNPGENETKPSGCTVNTEDVDCSYKDWSGWATCTKSCGGGQTTRQRQVQAMAQNNGAACTDALVETIPCKTDACPAGAGVTNCEWHEWGAWAACDQCGGHRTRTRHVQAPVNGGHACEMRASIIAAGCPVNCKARYFCAWGDWASWSDCSATCGYAYKSHRRDLVLTTIPANTSRLRLYEEHTDGLGKLVDADANSDAGSDLQERFQHLWRQSKREEAARTQELVAAFAAGSMGVLVLLLVIRVAKSRVTRSRDGDRSMPYTGLRPNDEFQVGNDELE